MYQCSRKRVFSSLERVMMKSFPESGKRISITNFLFYQLKRQND